MTDEQAIAILERGIPGDGVTREQIQEATARAVSALRAVHVDTNKMVPLTIEQLRGMDGRPAYWPEAWEPCGECEKQNCDNCHYSELLSSFEPCASCYNAKKWKPANKFCQHCGRPLTPDAWDELEKRLRG